jgi:uncharacterized protein YegP (UPF0339 family)
VIPEKSGVGREVGQMYFELIHSMSKRQYYFRLVAGNGRIITWSEYYINKSDAIAAIGLVMSTTKATPIKESVVA